MDFESVPKLSQISKVTQLLKYSVYYSIFWESDLSL